MSSRIPLGRSLTVAGLLTLAGPLSADAGPIPDPQTPPGDFSEEAPTTLPSLTGSWVLNQKASDDPLSVMQAAAGPQRDRPGGMGGPGGMQGGMEGGMGRGMGGGRGGPDMGDSPGGMGGGGRQGGGQAAGTADMNLGLRLKQEISGLEIFQQGAELNITDGLDISRLIVIGGGEAIIWTERGEVKASARWENGTLVEEWRPSGRGAGRTRRYALTEDGRQLIVQEERTVPGQERPFTVRLVYDRRP